MTDAHVPTSSLPICVDVWNLCDSDADLATSLTILLADGSAVAEIFDREEPCKPIERMHAVQPTASR